MQLLPLPRDGPLPALPFPVPPTPPGSSCWEYGSGEASARRGVGRRAVADTCPSRLSRRRRDLLARACTVAAQALHCAAGEACRAIMARPAAAPLSVIVTARAMPKARFASVPAFSNAINSFTDHGCITAANTTQQEPGDTRGRRPSPGTRRRHVHRARGRERCIENPRRHDERGTGTAQGKRQPSAIMAGAAHSWLIGIDDQQLYVTVALKSPGPAFR